MQPSIMCDLDLAVLISMATAFLVPVAGYDCSDVKGHTAAASTTPLQRHWRNLPVAAMARQGFVNYSKEWWHFSMPGVRGPAYDFPIRPR